MEKTHCGRSGVTSYAECPFRETFVILVTIDGLPCISGSEEFDTFSIRNNDCKYCCTSDNIKQNITGYITGAMYKHDCTQIISASDGPVVELKIQ